MSKFIACGRGVCAAEIWHEGTCAQASGWGKATDPRDTEHIRCNCVPTLGPPHCHLCSGDGWTQEWPCKHGDGA